MCRLDIAVGLFGGMHILNQRKSHRTYARCSIQMICDFIHDMRYEFEEAMERFGVRLLLLLTWVLAHD